MKRKIIAGILIIMGLAIMSAPLYWRWSGNRRNEQMLQEIEQIIERETENEEKEDNGQTAPEAAISEADAAIFAEGDVIAILDAKYA